MPTNSRPEERLPPEAGEGALARSVRMARDCADRHDPETARHLERMAQYARLIARQLAARRDLSDEFVEQVCLFAPLHDIGKVGIPEAILHKPEALTPDERGVMATHVELGIKLVEELIQRFHLERVSGIQVLRNIVACHHEYLDGSGYPHGLRGDAVPLEARIVTVADIFDALSSRRDYKRAWSAGEAFAVLERMSEIGQLDPACVRALVDQEDQIQGIMPPSGVG